MTQKQIREFENLWKGYLAAGGKMEVDGAPSGDFEEAVEGLSAYDTSQAESLMSHMRTLIVIIESLKNPKQHKPGYIPSRNSRPTLHVVTGDDWSHDATWGG